MHEDAKFQLHIARAACLVPRSVWDSKIVSNLLLPEVQQRGTTHDI